MCVCEGVWVVAKMLPIAWTGSHSRRLPQCECISVCVCCTCPKSAPAWYIIEPSMQHIAPHFARAPVAPFLRSLPLLFLLLVLKFDNSIKCALWRKKGAKKKRTGKNSSSSEGSRHGPRQGVTPSQSRSCTAVSTGQQLPTPPTLILVDSPLFGARVRRRVLLLWHRVWLCFPCQLICHNLSSPFWGFSFFVPFAQMLHVLAELSAPVLTSSHPLCYIV